MINVFKINFNFS